MIPRINIRPVSLDAKDNWSMIPKLSYGIGKVSNHVNPSTIPPSTYA
jgi:hypothetical protein